MGAGNNILRSELAGLWYTEDPRRLAREIDVYLDAVEPNDTGNIMALLLPHAGYRYSGMVAATAVRRIVGQSYSRVIVLGPSHRVALIDAVSMPDVEAVETPLGRIEIDRELAQMLWTSDRFQSHAVAHSHEHSVQIELPFLQRALGDFKLVPIVCGELGEASAKQVAATIREHMDAETLIVISSDFTHYGHAFDYVPFTDNIQENLKTLDMDAFKLVKEKNLTGFLHYVDKTKATICGRSPIAVLLAMLPDGARVEMLKYDTSGNLTGDWSHCVSYVSAAVTGTWSGSCPGEFHDERPFELTDADKSDLLRLARNAIARQFTGQGSELELEITPPMKRIMGAFVSLYKRGQLCGCIGEIYPRRELYQAITEQAVNAAFHDPRFIGLREDELDAVDLEISALTAPQRVNSYKDIQIGKHGIVLKKGDRSAVFLPQVATEQHWGLSETLTHLAMKAGLAPHDWKDGCAFHVFEAIVFGERR